MTDVGPVSQSRAAAASQTGRYNRSANQASSPQRAADRIELSDHAQLLSKLSQLPEVRQDLIDSVRAQIEDGTYDSDEKIDTAIERLAEDL